MAKKQKNDMLQIENWAALPIIVNGTKALKFFQTNLAYIAHTTQRY